MANRPGPFNPTSPGQNFRRNAVQHGYQFENDVYIGFGFISAADALVQHWVEHGPDDRLLLPMILNYRHGIELLLKAAIRDAARCLRDDGDPDRKILKVTLDEWLAKDAGHSLARLLNRLDEYLGRLERETVPSETRGTIESLHVLDPSGETFRYATSWDSQAKKFVAANRPSSTHIDVVAMGDVFHDAATMIGGGVLSIIDVYRDYQQSMGP